MLVKEQLKQQIKMAIKNSFEDGFNEAMKETALGDQSDNANKVMKKMADKFSKKAAQIVSDKLSGDLADIIDSYIKSMSITVTAAPSTALVSPVGPVTGVITIPPTFFQIN